MPHYHNFAAPSSATPTNTSGIRNKKSSTKIEDIKNDTKQNLYAWKNKVHVKVAFSMFLFLHF